MGDIKRKKKKFRKPKQPYNKTRIEEEDGVIKKYGLKNKREIWKIEVEVSKIRRRAKSLIRKTDEEKKEFFEKLGKQGIDVKDISDVLALTKEDLLNRRLQTVVFKKGCANTVKGARQKIVHKQVLVDGKVMNKPSFLVTKELESKIKLKSGEKKDGKE